MKDDAGQSGKSSHKRCKLGCLGLLIVGGLVVAGVVLDASLSNDGTTTGPYGGVSAVDVVGSADFPDTIVIQNLDDPVGTTHTPTRTRPKCIDGLADLTDDIEQTLDDAHALSRAFYEQRGFALAVDDAEVGDVLDEVQGNLGQAIQTREDLENLLQETQGLKDEIARLWRNLIPSQPSEVGDWFRSVAETYGASQCEIEDARCHLRQTRSNAQARSEAFTALAQAAKICLGREVLSERLSVLSELELEIANNADESLRAISE